MSSSHERDNLINHAMYNSQQPFASLKPKHVTKPMPFSFKTDNRIRLPNPNELKSREQKEIDEISRRPKFKARPVPKTVYSPKKIHINSKPPTQPMDVKLHTSQRSKNENIENVEHAYQSFRALPLNKEILERPDMLPDKQSRKLTVPVEFEFETAKRSIQSQNVSFESDCSQRNKNMNFSYQEYPKSSQPFKLQTDLRGREKAMNFQLQLEKEKELQDKMTSFTARPMPNFEPPKLDRTNYVPTKPEPFKFQLDNRIRSQTIDLEDNYNQFRARDVPDFSVPFEPEHRKLFTQPVDFILNSDIRAEKRTLFNEQIREKERQEELRRHREEQEVQLRHQQETKALRKQMEFKAQPIWENDFVPKPIVKNNPTVPNPFHFHTEERAELKEFNKGLEKSGFYSEASTTFSLNQSWNN